MKNQRRTYLSSRLQFLIVVMSILSIVGCEKQEFTSDINTIENSEEFKNYLECYLLMVSEYDNSKQLKKEKICERRGNVLYQLKKIDNELYKKTLDARVRLLEKFPEYSHLKVKKSTMAVNCLRSNSINISLEDDFPTVRLKSASPEDKTYADWRVEGFDDNDGQFNATAFDSFEEAMDTVRDYGGTYEEECCMWKLPDGSAVFITDNEASETSMTMPCENGIDWVAHYHPYNDGELSDADIDAMDTLYYNHGVDTFLIITDDSVFYYYWE